MPFKPPKVERPWMHKVEYNKMQGQGRKNVNPFYKSPQWTRFRNMFINGLSTHLGTKEPHSNRLCIECRREGRVVHTHTIDHIKQINQVNAYDTQQGRYGSPLEWENCQPLCAHHNAKKTGKERQTNKL